ncbi:MAG: hypothetical protein ISS31_02265 [Kiritimatiellae bacterium]|nr:hypothetical protein [Kiritimatiellia bacterium]
MEMKALDAYSLKARYYPTVIVLAPLCLVVLAVGSGVWDPMKGTISAVVSALGMALVMDQVGRDQGKKKEPRLYDAWGGKPSTRMLRHHDTTLDGVTRRRYHEKLAELIPSVRMPTVEDEAANPEAADAVYESCGAFLRQKTRGKDYALLFQENTNYGFRRNLWGMKSAGIVISIVGTLGCSGLTAWYLLAGKADWLVSGICASVCIVQLVLWTFRFTPDWVRIPAEEYARQLLAACDSLTPNQ